MAKKDLAYDLAMFEDKNAALKPYSKSNKRAMPQKIDYSEQEEKAKAKKRLQMREKRERTALISRILGLSIVVLILVTVTVYSKIILAETITAIDLQTVNLKELESKETQYRNIIDQKITHGKIEEYATKELGLVKMEFQQHKVINSVSGESVEIADQVEKTNVFEDMLNFFRGLGSDNDDEVPVIADDSGQDSSAVDDNIDAEDAPQIIANETDSMAQDMTETDENSQSDVEETETSTENVAHAHVYENVREFIE